ncbi:MAG: ACP S-malonyltransferase [Bacteroidota bacterium]|nr:ACP S-malonyltransferase [Bacteroidota bacterium]
MKAYIFPGQGAQFKGMGKDVYDSSKKAKDLFEQANEILGFRITDIMFEGSDDDLKQTKVTQPAIFIHSAVLAIISDIKPDMVAGHSLGEFTALVANGALNFADALSLVSKRALAMQKACEKTPGAMAAILGLDDAKVVEICASIKGETVVAANFNCPGQLVISGSVKGIEIACEQMKAAGAKRALPLPVGGAFHSPLMEPAKIELKDAIEKTNFSTPKAPVYQNVNALPSMDPSVIKSNLIAQLTGSVLWTQSVAKMHADGATQFIECGPGKVLQGLVGKIVQGVETSSVTINNYL